MAKNKNKGGSSLPPVKNLILSDENRMLRIILMVVFLVIALVAFYIGIRAVLDTEPGWEAVECASGEVNCSFGDYRIDLQGVKRIPEDCELEVNCSFGQVTLLVPSRFRVRPDSSTAFGDLSIVGQPDAEPQGTIHLEANVSFGQIVVEYI